MSESKIRSEQSEHTDAPPKKRQHLCGWGGYENEERSRVYRWICFCGTGRCKPAAQPEAGEEIVKALDLSLAFFEARDRMNSAVHDAPTRWSPITDVVRRAVAVIRRKA